MASSPPASKGSAQRTLIYLVRHCQTPLNQTDVLRGRADPPLDEVGWAQARRLAAAIDAMGLSAVYASPSLRAKQTAQPIADHAGLEIVIDERLQDRDYGPWTCVSGAAVGARWGSVDQAPGVEPRSAVQERAIEGVTDIARRCEGGTVVVVSHDAVTRSLLAAFRPELGEPDAIPQYNGCLNVLMWRRDGFVVLTVNELPRGLC